MNILAFDTSLNKTHIALLKDENLAFKTFESDENNYHSAYLIIGIKKILNESNLTLQDIDLFAVNNGPGSFTGIRAGVTVAKTLSKELNKPVIGLNSSDILYKAYETFDPDVVLDARREQFYFRNNVLNPKNASMVKNHSDISLIPYNEIMNVITKNAVICDSSSFNRLKEYLKGRVINLINFEDETPDIPKVLIVLAKEIYQNNKDENFGWNTLKAAYIQAPPIHKKNS